MRVKPLVAVFVTVLIVVSACATAKALPKERSAPLPIPSVLGARTFAELVPISVSPDGEWVAYTIKNQRRARLPNSDLAKQNDQGQLWSGTDIWLTNLRTGVNEDITSGQDSSWLPAWSPNGRYLAFLSDRRQENRPHLWIWDDVSGKTRMLSGIVVHTYQIEWLPNSSRLVVTTLPRNQTDENLEPERAGRSMVRANLSAVPGPTVALYQWPDSGNSPPDHRIAGPWDLNESLRDLIAVDVPTSKTSVLVSHTRIPWYRPSPDGSTIAYTIPQRFERPESQQILFDLAAVNTSSLRQRTLVRLIRLDADGDAFTWSPNDDQLAFHAGGMDETHFDCYVIDMAGASVRNLTHFNEPTPARHKSSIPLWGPNGAIYFVQNGALWSAASHGGDPKMIAAIPNREITHLISGTPNTLWTVNAGHSTVVVTHDDTAKQDGFYRIDFLNGQSAVLLEHQQCYTCTNSLQQFIVTSDQRHMLYFAEDAQHAPDLWMANTNLRHLRRVTHLEDQFDEYRLGTTRLIHWRSDDGEPLEGVLLLPANYDRHERYPLVVWVYGGASLSNDLDQFGLVSQGPFNLQLFATRGYAVLLPDAPLRLGTPMSDLAKAVLPGVNKVIEMGVADPKRLAAIGHSFGGYSVLSLIAQTRRFAAAIEIDGAGSLLNLYGEMDRDGNDYGIPLLEHGQGLMGGTPWQFRSRYIENSPVTYLDRIDTPLLIVHGSNDSIVSPFLGDQLFVGLRRLGKPVEYAKYLNEGHSPLYWSYANQLDLCNRMFAWLAAHLKGAHRVSEWDESATVSDRRN